MIVSDSFLDAFMHESIYKTCMKANYNYGEIDDLGDVPVGMVSNLEARLIKALDPLFKKEFQLHEMKLYRAYINCFAPSEHPNFHVDHDCPTAKTVLYYVNTEVWDKNEGGETQFLINDQITGVLPIPNRAVCFDSHILHRATSYRSRHRFTLAFKYE